MVVLVAAGAWAVTSYLTRTESARDELARRLEASSDPPRFAIAYAAGGTRVNDCFLPNRRFVVFVDRPARTLAVARAAADRTPIALWRNGRVLLHRSLFRADALPRDWLAVPADIDGTPRDALRRALGVDLAGYLLTEDLPATGRATALAALDVAQSVRRDAGNPDTVDRFAVTVDADLFAAVTDSTVPSPSAAPTTGAGPTTATVPTPTLDVSLEAGGAVARIDVRLADAEGGGWTTEYTASTTVPPTIPAADVVAIADIDPARLAGPASATCQLPL